MELNRDQIEFLKDSTDGGPQTKYMKGKWNLNEKTGLVDINGSFCCANRKLTDFKGVKFGVVTGHFCCSYNNLTSLEGAPQGVHGDFDCSFNNLTSLEGAPQEVQRNFYCFCNNLTSLEGAPQKVSDFNCQNNKLTSLVGSPKEVRWKFDCSYNNLTSLEGLVKPPLVWFKCEGNPISKDTLGLVCKTMQENNVDYWMALCIIRSSIDKNEFDKMSIGIDKHISKVGGKGISMLGQFGIFK